MAAVLATDDVIRRLVALKPDLHALKIRSLAVFGSAARGEATPASDFDLLVEFSETPDLFEFIRIRDRLSELVGRPVDLVTRDALHHRLRERILGEAVNAF